MKRRVAQIFSALLTAVYLLAEVGFDVHCDNQRNRTYLVPLFSGISCEEIHPEHPCHHHHHEGCEAHEDCCTNTIEYLQASVEQSECISLPDCPSLELCTDYPQSAAYPAGYAVSEGFKPSPSPPRLQLRRLCILRV